MKVTLVTYTNKPIDSICVAVNCMGQKYPLSFTETMTKDQKREMINQVFKSKLRGALEFADFHFHVEGVTRAFTHQLVRHRLASFSQQSLRFFDAKESGFRVPTVGPDHKALIEETYGIIRRNYAQLLKNHCPTEEARSILPTNILTLISFRMTYRALVEMAEVRLCAQTQGEFQEVMNAIKEEMARVEPFLASKLVSACERTGRCEFKSTFDRECPKGRNK